jgi:hypothetical protein
MTGTLSSLLTRQFGASSPSSAGDAQHWNTGDAMRECVLFDSLQWTTDLRNAWGILEQIYGDARGGFLLGDTLKVAVLDGPAVFGLPTIEQLHERPEVQQASELEPRICYFMDSANVWFYGLKDSQLFVYDAETDELDCLGDIEQALKRLLEEQP